MVSVPAWVSVWQIGVLLALGISLGVVRSIDAYYDWGRTRRSRLLLGIPWGTLVSIVFVLGVYWIIQDARTNWYHPVTIPFRSWSYFYPTGMLFAAFAHNSAGHITSNLLGTIVFGTLAEYAWGHYPSDRGQMTFSSFTTNPYVRAFVLFPLGVFLIGILTAVFGWGPLIGFSGVVFAMAGFALFHYPILTVVALAARQVVRTLFGAVTNPVVVSQAEPQFVTPWWAGTAVQAHLLGLFLGLVVAAVVFRRDEVRPTRLWAGAVLVVMSLSIWAIWWYRGGDEYVLYQGLGVFFVLALALLITTGAWLLPRTRTIANVPVRVIGLLLLIFPILVVGFVAVPLNLATVGEAAPPGTDDPITIEGYTITYAENVTDQSVNIINRDIFNESTAVKRSGVIVINENRHAWNVDVSKDRLSFDGRARVRVGGVTWQEDVWVYRDGWDVVQNDSVYAVYLRAGDGPWEQKFRSPGAIAEPVINGYQVRVDPTRDGFTLSILSNGTVVNQTVVPPENETSATSTLSFTRADSSVYVSKGDTRVRIMTKETYDD